LWVRTFFSWLNLWGPRLPALMSPCSFSRARGGSSACSEGRPVPCKYSGQELFQEHFTVSTAGIRSSIPSAICFTGCFYSIKCGWSYRLLPVVLALLMSPMDSYHVRATLLTVVDDDNWQAYLDEDSLRYNRCWEVQYAPVFQCCPCPAGGGQRRKCRAAMLADHWCACWSMAPLSHSHMKKAPHASCQAMDEDDDASILC
jgi:hypothetical protein